MIEKSRITYCEFSLLHFLRHSTQKKKKKITLSLTQCPHASDPFITDINLDLSLARVAKKGEANSAFSDDSKKGQSIGKGLPYLDVFLHCGFETD